MPEFDEKKLEIAENYCMPYGKFKRQTLKDIPNWYITWLAANAYTEIVCDYADIIRRWRERYGIEI